MNEQQIEKSERVASGVMRFLAVTGLVAVLALIAWLVVQGIRLMPNLGQNITAAVSSVTSVFRSAPEEDIVFDLSSRTLTSGQQVVVRWNYVGTSEESARFSYDCARNVTLSIESNGSWQDVVCGQEVEIENNMFTMIPTSPKTRFADLTLHVSRGDVEDATLVTVVNTELATERDDLFVVETSTSTPSDDVAPVTDVPTETTANTPTVVAPTPVSPAPAPTPVVATPRVLAPADLVVNIEETGVYVPVAGRDTFFPVSPIPSEKRAGVIFTVTNRGEKPSGAWGFVANLPIEGDMKYRYASPVQAPLAPGMQVQFTLGFDEVIAKGKGLIRIELLPTGEDVSAGNNIDAAIVEFK